jgi:soluble lytic murein transglycosylase
MKSINFRFLTPILFGLTLTASVAEAATVDAQNYRRAFTVLDNGHPEQAVIFAQRGHDEIINKVLRSAYMAQAGNDVPFNVLVNFMASEREWPNLKAIQSVAESKLPSNASPQQLGEWFEKYPPVSLIGFYRYVDALNLLGQSQKAETLIRDRWVTDDFTADQLTAFYGRFSPLIDREAIWARLDRVLWKNDVEHARQLYLYADAAMKAVAEARLALANQTSNAESLISRVPDAWQNEPGLLYERLRWRRRNNMDEAAVGILRHAPPRLGNAEAWWEERQVILRRVMMTHDYDLAYELAADHGQTDAKTVVQGEFLAGWLALRFLNDPARAFQHFKVLLDKATTPISRARGEYWLARAAEAAGDRNAAEAHYAAAAVFNMTYYGQLAGARLDTTPIIQSTPEPAIPPALRARFYNRDVVEAVEHLSRYGQRDRARIYFRSAMNAATQRVDFAMLTELAYRIDRPDLAIETAKAANQKNMMIAAGGYPLIDRTTPQPPEPALTHALIRQESMFNPEAQSGVGAQGLMQLMPATAKGVAKKLGMRFRSQKLGDPDFNMRLGTSYVQSQISSFDGSYILAIAGYNAGPGRVRQWMGQWGDPRSSSIDAIDWIESIPVNETRNYVQRVIENLQIYRARLRGGQAPLMILKDLRR